MNRDNRSAALLCLAILSMGLTACTEHKPVPRPDVKINSNPIDKYEITVRIEDKVSPPRGITGKATYQIDNREQCLPVDYTLAIGGVRLAGYHEQSIVYERISDYVFQAYVYEDAVHNENYYGLATCDWGIASIHANIVINTSIQKSSITKNNIEDESVHIVFCPNNDQYGFMQGKACISKELFSRRDSSTKEKYYRTEILSRRMTP